MALINAAVLLAFALRFLDDGIPTRYWLAYLRHAPFLTIVSLAVMYAFGVNRTIWRYASTRTISSIVQATSVSTVLLAAWNMVASGQPFPRSVLALTWMSQIFLIGGSRLLWRLYKEQGLPRPHKRVHRVLIAGAGDAGEMLAREMSRNRGESRAIGFVDDNPLKQGTAVDRVRVLGTTFDIPWILREKKVDEVIIAAPSAPARLVRDIVRCCEEANVRCRTLPDLDHFMKGSAALVQVRDIELEDLLGREQVPMDMQGVSEFLSGRVVLVTGAGGSIGSELCRQIAPFQPRRIIMLDHCENRLCYSQLELAAQAPALAVTTVVGDIKDAVGMERLFQKERPDVVFHAAAHKHVNFLENSPREAVLNNIIGTRNVAEAAERARVGHFVFISTDKAVNPSSVMGASKRACEMLVQCISRHGITSFVSVRFGNVLGSDGSVVPIFRRQIARGGPVTVTHPDARRYFMTVSEAARLVVQAGALGRAGQVYVLDMGEQLRVLDVARQLIRLSGLIEGRDMEIRYTGLRPGEKLEEELLTREERSRVTEHRRIYVWDAGAADERELRTHIDALFEAAVDGETETIRAALQALVPEYGPVRDALPVTSSADTEPVRRKPLSVPVAVVSDGALPSWKRTLDIAVGSLTLAVAVPVAGVIVLAKLCTGATPIFAREERVGVNRRLIESRRRAETQMPIDRRRRERRNRRLPGKPFVCWRFAVAPERRKGVSGHVDFLVRNYRLDKLPYLLSVVKGDMSLVGPKAEKLSVVQSLRWESGVYAERFLVVPGLTGPAQAIGCPDHHQEGFSRRVEYDLFYVHHRSLSLDVRMLVRTLPVLLAGRRRTSNAWRGQNSLVDGAMPGTGGLRN
jgi:FlaA1/EpsC-like NDP-sugar epimerase/lipopolysaccharide/colanic/teichoic acid biosynthesis glycosyltransferase